MQQQRPSMRQSGATTPPRRSNTPPRGRPARSSRAAAAKAAKSSRAAAKAAKTARLQQVCPPPAGALSARFPVRGAIRSEWRPDDVSRLAELTESADMSALMRSSMRTIASLHAALDALILSAGEMETNEGAKLAAAHKLVHQLGRQLEIHPTSMYDGLHAQETLHAWRVFEHTLRVQMVLAPLRRGVYSRGRTADGWVEEAAGALDGHFAEEMMEHDAATKLQALARGRVVRKSFEAMIRAMRTGEDLDDDWQVRVWEEAVDAVSPLTSMLSTVQAFGKLRGYRQGQGLQDSEERAAFQHLLRAVEAALTGDADALRRALRPTPGVPALELHDALPPIQSWVCSLTQGLSAYHLGRIIARKREG